MTDSRLFGTDGVRGLANQAPMTAEMALRLGQSMARVFRDTQDIQTVLIGKDTRQSGYLFESALTAGICSVGLDVFLVGPMPTPAVAHLTRSMCANAGIMISASHNPACDNGIKLFSDRGVKLSDQHEQEIEKIYFSDFIKLAEPGQVGKAYRMDQAQGRYLEFAKSTINYLDLSGIRMVLDCANGAAYSVAPKVFTELGIDLTVINDQPDGMNINLNCGALHLEGLSERVLAEKADLGIALDGDADRIIMVDGKGQVIDGDQILALSAIIMKESGRLKDDTVVTTVMSNIGLFHLMKEKGISIRQTQVGDRYVVDEMMSQGFNLGGEQSGHIIFSDHIMTGDGIIAGLQVLNMMKETGSSLEDLASVMTKAPQRLINIEVTSKPDFSDVGGLQDAMQESEERLGDSGRLLVRYSGTESIARVLVEGMDGSLVDVEAERLADVIRNRIGV